ncbi:hypothetical protein Lal_00022638 [Lupinus albus]|nr:hypothetical protein Lal_00022638 [Lupinus albus]
MQCCICVAFLIPVHSENEEFHERKRRSLNVKETFISWLWCYGGPFPLRNGNVACLVIRRPLIQILEAASSLVRRS